MDCAGNLLLDGLKFKQGHWNHHIDEDSGHKGPGEKKALFDNVNLAVEEKWNKAEGRCYGQSEGETKACMWSAGYLKGNKTAYTCGGIHLQRVKPASPRHGDVSWVGSTPRSPVTGFAVHTKLALFVSAGASAVYTLSFGFNPGDATGTQWVGLWSVC